MSGYLQYSNYGDDEPPTPAPQPKRTLRTNQRTLRSRPPAARPTAQSAQQMKPMQSAQTAQSAQPMKPAHDKYVQELIQQIHNGEGDSDSESSDSDTNYFSQTHQSQQSQQSQQMQQQFQTQPVANRNRFAAANSSDLSAKLNPAPATATSMVAREGFSLANALFQASSNETGAGENKDVLLQKLDHIISLLEDQQDAKTGHVTEELVLYCFLGVFIIFIVDSFARAGKYVR